MALNLRHFLIILTLAALISTTCAADSKGLIGKILTEAGKVTQAQLDVDKFAIKDVAVLLQVAANACL